MLLGRLGLEKARIPYADRHGLIWLDRGRLEVEDGCLRFVTAGGELPAGDYQIPHQTVSLVLLGPGASVTHDALRILARHGCMLAAVGEGGTRLYTAPPLMPDSSAAARAQVRLWADPEKRMEVARAMFAIRFGEIVRTRDIEVLRGREGARIKRSYQLAAERHGIEWDGRRYDRGNPGAGDDANQAINHAGSAMSAAAAIAVTAVGAIPQLGFVHEDSGTVLRSRHRRPLSPRCSARHCLRRGKAGRATGFHRKGRAAPGLNAHSPEGHHSLDDRPHQTAAGAYRSRGRRRERGHGLMPMVVVITRDVEARYRGFLGSAMLELAPGVYAHPRMSAGVRQRLFAVLEEWHGQLGRGSILMTWGDNAANGGLGLTMLGEPPKGIVAHDGMLLTSRAWPGEEPETAATDIPF